VKYVAPPSISRHSSRHPCSVTGGRQFYITPFEWGWCQGWQKLFQNCERGKIIKHKILVNKGETN